MSPGEDLTELVVEATARVDEQDLAVLKSAEKQRPKSRRQRAIALGIALAATVALDVFLWTRPPQTISADLQRVDAGWLMADAVAVVEGLRGEAGTLPTSDVVAPLLGWEIAYVRDGTTYRIIAEIEGALVEYDSREPLPEWMARQGLNLSAGR